MWLTWMARLNIAVLKKFDIAEWEDKITFGLRKDYISVSPKWLLKKIES